MIQKIEDEYFFLTEKLEEIKLALEGKCDDIDCDQYLFKELLKKKYKPVLEHNFSCVPKLKKEKEAILNILSDKRFKSQRYTKCDVCNKKLDKLNEENETIMFTHPLKENRNYHEAKFSKTHKNCKQKLKTPKEWEKLL